MNRTYSTAREAIDESAAYDHSTECADTAANRRYLLAASDGDGDTNDGHEYWADDPSDRTCSAMLWRVSVRATRDAEQ